jgi:hypothetical protein
MPNIANVMKDWEYTFDQASKEEWIRQIEKDLRQKPLKSAYSEWWPGAPLDPFIHSEDVNDDLVRLPDLLFAQSPKITEWIEVDTLSAEAVNQIIVESLQFGAQTIIIKTDVINENLISEWLKGVYLEMVSVSIQTTDTFWTNDQISQENVESKVDLRIERNPASPSLSFLLDRTQQIKKGLEEIRFIYRFPSSGLWDLETSTTFKRLLSDLANWKSSGMNQSDFFNQCVLVLEADEEYFKNILQARVLHLVWQNLKAKFSIEPLNQDHAYLECHILPKVNEHADHYLIRASMSGLAASLSGISSLCFHSALGANSPSFYKRINRNIHHLLELESGMYKSVDPLAGAYALDFYTKQVTERIWSMLF